MNVIASAAKPSSLFVREQAGLLPRFPPPQGAVIVRLAAFAKASAGQGDRMSRRSLGVEGTGRSSTPRLFDFIISVSGILVAPLRGGRPKDIYSTKIRN